VDANFTPFTCALTLHTEAVSYERRFCFLLMISVSGAHFPTFRVLFPTFKNSKPVSYVWPKNHAGFEGVSRLIFAPSFARQSWPKRNCPTSMKSSLWHEGLTMADSDHSLKLLDLKIMEKYRGSLASWRIE
jgi:hypothetical protein